jgi:DNA-binding beta-propeller fold protein YncE
MKKALMLLFLFGLSACAGSKEWVYDKTISLNDASPIGFAFTDTGIWVSDGTGNRVLKIDEKGNLLSELSGLSRPMHIDFNNGRLFVPEYTADSVKVWNGATWSHLTLSAALDAPAGVAVQGNDFVIADFYHHQLQAQRNGKALIIGKKGKALGEFEYPTDVQFANGKIYVADAYNHRGQILDANGTAQLIFGASDNINAATGVFANRQQIFLTDFENHRILVYDSNGNLQQILKDHLANPIDVLQFGKWLWIANFKAKSIAVYRQ